MIRYITFAVFSLIACVLVYEGGQRGAQAYERMLIDRIHQGLAAIDIDWIRIESDGLRVELHGRAPSVDGQALALRTARATAPFAHVVDYSSATLTPLTKRDPVHLELHRDQTGIIVTGRVHGERMQRQIQDGLSRIVPDLPVHDLSGDDASEPSTGWGPELDLAFLAISSLADTYLTVVPGRVRIEGVVPDVAARESFGAELVALAGPDIELSLDLRTPPRAITPFEFIVVKGFSGLRIETCAARSIAERNRIMQALTRAGVTEHGRSCAYGLGGPDGDWLGAIEAGLLGLRQLPTGRLSIAYEDVRIDPLQPVETSVINQMHTEVVAALPADFELLDRTVPPAETVAAPKDGYWLSIRDQDTLLVIEGRAAGQAEADALRLYARARFPATSVITRIQMIDTAVPADWHIATLAAVDALHLIADGTADLSPGRLIVSGVSPAPETAGRLHRDLEAALPTFDVSTSLTVDVPNAIQRLPLSDTACVGQMNRIIAEKPIEFSTGKATIETSSVELLELLAGVYSQCGSVEIAIAGHTDSKGTEEYNQRLSESRAEAVMDALIERGIPHSRLTALGLGEAEPLVSNETEDGRAKNRRIEFRLGG